jgi:CubicO group peptidase (beta-lactamase class C family)
MKFLIFFLLVLNVLTTSCDSVLLGEDEAFRTAEENLQPPPDLNDGWEVSTLEAENINRAPIENVIRRLHQDPRRVHSLLLIKNNKLVLESYFEGWHRNRLQSLRSASKSFASTLIGIAIDKQFISSVEEPLYTFFPEYADLFIEEKKSIQLKHVLSMTSGFKWNQFDSNDESNDENQMGKTDDALRFVIEKDLISTPGKSFLYNSGNSDLLMGVLHNSTGIYADKFAEEHLFKPLGITDYEWITHKNGFINAGWGLFLKPRDMAKLGQLFLDSGLWKGQQVVSKRWVKQAASKFITANQWQDYGYQWWLEERTVKGRTIRSIQAQGNGGQVIFVVPELNAVVVFTGGNYGSKEGQIPYTLFGNFILNALL